MTHISRVCFLSTRLHIQQKLIASPTCPTVCKSWVKNLVHSSPYTTTTAQVPSKSKLFMPSPGLIEADGFGVEKHPVITKDGYQLTIFQVKGGLKGPVLLQHGLLSSSDDWIVRRPHHDNLPYMLAVNGWDVWMGNFRGNRYSSGHVSLSPLESPYWNFGFHEMGQFDLPIFINHVLDVSKTDKLAYIGYSMGGTAGFVALDQDPSLNDKIKGMIGLAPAGHIGQSTSPFRSYVAKILPSTFIQGILDYTNEGHVIPHKLGQKLSKERRRKLTVDQFDNFVRLFDGHHPGSILNDTIDMIMGHCPSDTSAKTIAHFHQLWLTDKFQQFDHSQKENLEKYKSNDPPPYDLSRVSCPVFILYGPNDRLVDPKDIQKTAKDIGDNVKMCQPVNDPLFNHLDFIYGKDAPDLVYKPCLDILESLF